MAPLPFRLMVLGVALSLICNTGAWPHQHPTHTRLAIAAPVSVPEDASWPVPHDFASFSFPAHFFTDYAGNTTTPNLFSRDILDLLYSKTGAHPYIRVGGTSTDRVWYNASQVEASINWFNESGTTTTSYGIPDAVRIGPSFFGGFTNFPGTRWSWQLNMGSTYGKPGGLENAVETASLVLEQVQSNLDCFEIGNEPNLMYWFGERPENFSLVDYIAQWNEYADAASDVILQNNSYGLPKERFFQPLTLSDGETEGWGLDEAFAQGLDAHGHVKSISYHQYAAGNEAWVRLQNSFMNHTANAANVSQYDRDIAIAHNYTPYLPFVLGETNSDSSNLLMAQVEGVFGSALWLIDHLLLGMAHNITRYNLIQGTTFGYSAWVPVESDGRQPYVRAPLYGQIFAADVLGHDMSVQVAPINGLPWNVSAYGVYSSGRLSKYVVINFDEWNATTPYARPTLGVQLKVPGYARSAEVCRLTGDGASADEGIQWSGQSWNYTNGRLAEQGHYHCERHSIPHGGTLELKLPSTEAALVTFKNKWY